MLERKCPQSGYAGTPLAWGLGSISDRILWDGFFLVFLKFDFISYRKLLQLYHLWFPTIFFSIEKFTNFKVNELLNASFIEI